MLRTIAAAAAALIYPLGVWACLHAGHPAWAAAVVASVALATSLLRRSRASLACAGIAALLATLTAVSSDAFAVKLYPVIVNAVMLSIFAASLTSGQSVCERFARLRHRSSLLAPWRTAGERPSHGAFFLLSTVPWRSIRPCGGPTTGGPFTTV